MACVDGFQLLNLTTVTTVAGGTAGQTTAQRITSLLDAGEWPGGMRDISTTSTTTVQADDGTSRSKSESTISKKAYKSLLSGFED